MLYFKALSKGRRPPIQSNKSPWPLPGVWTPKCSYVRTCYSGWHMAPASHLGSWIDYDELWLAEGRGKKDTEIGKVAWEQARLVRKLDTSEKVRKEVVKHLKSECKRLNIDYSNYFCGKLYLRSEFANLIGTLLRWMKGEYFEDRKEGELSISVLTKLFSIWDIESGSIVPSKRKKVTW